MCVPLRVVMLAEHYSITASLLSTNNSVSLRHCIYAGGGYFMGGGGVAGGSSRSQISQSLSDLFEQAGLEGDFMWDGLRGMNY